MADQRQTDPWWEADEFVLRFDGGGHSACASVLAVTAMAADLPAQNSMGVISGQPGLDSSWQLLVVGGLQVAGRRHWRVVGSRLPQCDLAPCHQVIVPF